MTENDARNALLIRSFETAPPSPQWDDEDRDWASRSAAQIEGEQASAEAFVVRRAGLAAERLAKRVPAVATALSTLRWRPWIGVLLLLAALAAGALLDAVSADQRINILAPPVLAILLWNIAVYAWLLGSGLRRLVLRRSGGTAGAARPARDAEPAVGDGGAGGALSRLINRIASGGVPVPGKRLSAHTPLAVFARHWAVAGAALNGNRTLALLHAGAALFAAGAAAGLYLRGLAFEYRAGWQSTFLDAGAVKLLLDMVLAPASLLTGIALPDAARLATLRLPEGTGENAAPWIHLYAVTLLLVVIVPRLALAAIAWVRARRLARNFPLPLADAYFGNLQRQHRGEAAVVHVLPYSYQLPIESVRGLNRLLQAVYGPATVVTIAQAVALGAEDRLRDARRHGPPPTLTVALFSLSATPEVENHAAFIATLARTLPADALLVAMVDESAFRARFGAESARLETRRAAWRKILASGIDIEPFFVALAGDDDITAAKARLGEQLHQNSSRLMQNQRFAAAVSAPV